MLRRVLWISVVVLVLVNGYFLLFYSWNGRSSPDDELRTRVENERGMFEQLSFWKRMLKMTQDDQDALLPHSAYDGLPLDEGTEESVVTLMIDNFSTARPQHTGIRSASLVYEALVEGGITRLMLVMPYQNLAIVGPIRSARDYFVDFAEEYGGIYVHAGGSPQAIQQLENSRRIFQLDEDDRLEGETYSFRDHRYDAPHNLFVDLFLVREQAESKGWKVVDSQVNWCFLKESDQQISQDEGGHENHVEQDEQATQVGKLELNFSHDPYSSYYVQFDYDELSKTYLRSYRKVNPVAHRDARDGEIVSPRNVIVQISPSSLIEGDAKERLTMNHQGTGKAFVFQEGQMREASWSKPNQSSSTQYLFEDGTPVCLIPGQTWIAILDNETLLETSP